MYKQKRWQLVLIIAVVLLTIYNILPTLFFYSKPLGKAVEKPQAETVVKSALNRVNSLQPSSISWVKSYSSLLDIKPESVKADEDPQYIQVTFKSVEDADKFKQHLPKAGALIPFVPAQLSLSLVSNNPASKTVLIQRNIPVSFDAKEDLKNFTYAKRFVDGSATTEYQEVLNDRLSNLATTVGGSSENALLLDAVLHLHDEARVEEFVFTLAQNIQSYAKIFGEKSPIAKRFFATLTQGYFSDRKSAVDGFITKINAVKDHIRLERIALQEKEKKLKDDTSYLDTADQQKLGLLQKREELLTSVASLVKRQSSSFASGSTPLSFASVESPINTLTQNGYTAPLSIGTNSPLIDSIRIDFATDNAYLNLHEDILAFQKELEQTKGKSQTKDQLEQLIFNEIARISRDSQELLTPTKGAFQASLSSVTGSLSFIKYDLSHIAEKEAAQIKQLIEANWNPKHQDLQASVFPIWDYETYKNLPASEKKLGLYIFSPLASKSATPQGMKNNSVYIVARGLEQIISKYKNHPSSPQARQFFADFESLRKVLTSKGYYGYPGNTYPLASQFSKDFIFENEDYFNMILKATRENFKVLGTKKFATLEFSDVKQRILASNQIDNQVHEDLLKWRDEYNVAQVNPILDARFDVPKPTQNPLISNFLLSAKKYFRGDERKILHWGLDLAGGKTIQIELRDSNNRKVTNDADIRQGINELFRRVNKMGVSEVSIRQDGSNITLDFPGAQNLSASDLVKASSMFFHIVNETFSLSNPDLAEHVNRFLQDIWNEAVVTNRKDSESINRIACKHLYGDALDPDSVQPRSDSARVLYDANLRIALPDDTYVSNTYDTTFSKIAILRGENFSDWHGQSHPLMFVFNNYALEGSSLENTHASYDPSKGNYLAFGIRSSQTNSDGVKTNPRADLYSWTSVYAKEKISGTPAAKVSRGRGWRMAVILNGTVISAPGLESALKDSAMISGSFTQREINKLEADLKAGSLTYAPYILSEKNVSPELGLKERYQGVIATIVALALVILTMVGYYRFGGLIASLAVTFNLLVMWAAYQNIQATLTLAGIAGVILTLGMAVDANVLVFERIREEFKLTGKIATAVQAGYKKAFSAILDSNITTIIAALILLHFDSGPIKGFAMTIIIGIVSSMFTALFMTRYFFVSWAQKPKNKELKMASWIKPKKFDFLRYGKAGIIVSAVIVVAGIATLTLQKHSIFGMDFTGGYALNLELEQGKSNYRSTVESALVKHGLSSQDFEVRELSPSNNIRIFLSKNLDSSGMPFYNMPMLTSEEVGFSYENNPRIVWIVDALNADNISIANASLKKLEQNWTSIGSQISDSMKQNAFIGLALALVAILLYITIRFEFKYALCATLGLAHDVFVTLGSICILHALKVPVQIDLNAIAALMTIIGYSLNDTIIIFDRIREDAKKTKKLAFRDIVNTALNTTLSRTLLTSFTTLVVLLALVCLGGSTVFGFALVMTIGVFYGTLSSLFVASPLLYWMQRYEERKDSSKTYIQNKSQAK